MFGRRNPHLVPARTCLQASSPGTLSGAQKAEPRAMSDPRPETTVPACIKHRVPLTQTSRFHLWDWAGYVDLKEITGKIHVAQLTGGRVGRRGQPHSGLPGGGGNHAGLQRAASDPSPFHRPAPRRGGWGVGETPRAASRLRRGWCWREARPVCPCPPPLCDSGSPRAAWGYPPPAHALCPAADRRQRLPASPNLTPPWRHRPLLASHQ